MPGSFTFTGRANYNRDRPAVAVITVAIGKVVAEMARLFAFFIAATWVCFSAARPAEADNLVDNGNFATGTFADWAVAPAESGSNIRVYGGDPYSGDYDALFGAVGSTDDSIYQTIDTIAGNSYSVDFYLRHAASDDENDFTASWNGDPLLALHNAAAFGWTEYTYDVTASSSSANLEFSGREVPIFYFLDDVSVVDTSMVAVPEPSTAIDLLALSVPATLGILRRRRFPPAAISLACAAGSGNSSPQR
jgi:hypothetical protein